MTWYAYDANGFFLRAGKVQTENATELEPPKPYQTARFVSGEWTTSANRSAIETAAAKRADLWATADRVAMQFDHNSRAKALAWLNDPACPTWRRDRIQAINTWMDNIWGGYYWAVAQLAGGNLTVQLPAVPAIPYTFANLLAE